MPGLCATTRSGHSPIRVSIDAIVADQRYTDTAEMAIAADIDLIAIEYSGMSFNTRPGKLVYLYRLVGYEDQWRQTRAQRVEYIDLPTGDYVFEIKAVDVDLNYSPEPARAKIAIHPRYGLIGLWCGLGLALVGLALTAGVAVRRRQALMREQQARLQAQEALNRALAESNASGGGMQTAHQLQMSLMPTQQPQAAGFDISGRCISATHVGGDFYQYFQQGGKLSICLADVTGHAMQAAVPVMMFSGVLKTEIRLAAPVDQLFYHLNNAMYDSLDSRTFVCFALGELETAPRILRLANGGCPYPYHYRAASGEVAELEVDAYPLGVRTEATYPVVERSLELGDYIIFCSDGIIEAANLAGDDFGFERTAATIRAGCAEGLSAEKLIERLVGAVQAFAGDEPQGDDMTCVVLRVENG